MMTGRGGAGVAALGRGWRLGVAGLALLTLAGCGSLGLDGLMGDDAPPAPTPATPVAESAPPPAPPAALPLASPPASGTPAAGAPTSPVPASPIPASGAPAPVTPAPASPPSAPAPGPAPVWAKVCDHQPGGQALCYVEQYAITAQAHTVLLHVEIGPMGPQGKPRMVVITPLGVGLQGGLSLSLDGGRPIALLYDSCQPAGCVAFADLDPVALSRFEDGKTMMFRYEGAQRRPLDVPITLPGLRDALAALPR